MLRYSLIVLFLLILFSFSFANNTINNFGIIKVKVVNINSNNGIIRSHIYREIDSKSFPKKTSNCYRRGYGEISNNQSIIIYDSLEYGYYAISVHHDENNDGWMNKTFLGYPAEGFGLSNNPKIFLSVPNFEDCKILLEKDTLSIVIKMKYL
jgi:uncharacterized protein (DUF2141 family)